MLQTDVFGGLERFMGDYGGSIMAWIGGPGDVVGGADVARLRAGTLRRGR